MNFSVRIFILTVFVFVISCKNKKNVVSINDDKVYTNPVTSMNPTNATAKDFQCNGVDQANWEFVGPEKYLDSKWQWHGFVWNVLGDERNYPEDMTKNIMIGTAGSGLWRFEETADGTKEWTCKTDNLDLHGLRVNDIVRDPCNPEHIMAATGMYGIGPSTFGNGIISSFDNGANWKIEPFAKTKMTYDDAVLRVFYDRYSPCGSKDGTYYILKKRLKEYQLGLFKNGKYQSLKIPEFKSSHFDVYDVEQVGKNSLLLSSSYRYGREASVYLTTNNGQSWTNIIDRLPEFPMNSDKKVGCTRCSPNRGCYCRPGKISISVELNGTIFLYMSNQMFYQSNDSGKSWERLPIDRLSRVDNNKLDIKQSPYTGNVFFGGIQPWVWNGEKPIKYNQGHDDVRDYHFLGYNEETKEEKVLLANDGGISLVTFNTETNKGSWEDVCGDSFPITQLNGIGIAQSKEENYVLGIMHCNSFHFNGEDWKKIGGGDGGSCLIDPMDKSNYFASGNPTLMKYGGERPKRVYTSNSWILRKPVKIHPANSNLIYAGKGKAKGKDCGKKSFASIMVYDDETSKADYIPIRSCELEFPSAIGLSFSKPEIIMVAGGQQDDKKAGKLVKSDDYGETWEDLSEGQVSLESGKIVSLSTVVAWKNIKDILINPINEKEIYICLSNHYEESKKRVHGKQRVFKSSNGGRTWEDYSIGLPSVAMNCFLYEHQSPNRIYLGTELGVYYTEDGMDGWVCYNNGMPNVEITELEINYCRNELYAGTYGRGLWRTALDLPKWREPLIISKNQTWDDDRVLYGDLLIKKNTVLTTTGYIMMAPNTRIYTESGASIDIQGDFKCLCEDDGNCGETIYLD